MSLMQDIVKMNLVRYGYLPNYPYHMISNKEMCDAFLSRRDDTYSGFMVDNYPCENSVLADQYNDLLDSMYSALNDFCDELNTVDMIPDWIYSYMIGSVIGPRSNVQDIHDLLVLLDLDNLDDVFTPEVYSACFSISLNWLKKLSSSSSRPPCMFGEPHVIKSLRLMQVNINRG